MVVVKVVKVVKEVVDFKNRRIPRHGRITIVTGRVV